MTDDEEIKKLEKEEKKETKEFKEEHPETFDEEDEEESEEETPIGSYKGSEPLPSEQMKSGVLDESLGEKVSRKTEQFAEDIIEPAKDAPRIVSRAARGAFLGAKEAFEPDQPAGEVLVASKGVASKLVEGGRSFVSGISLGAHKAYDVISHTEAAGWVSAGKNVLTGGARGIGGKAKDLSSFERMISKRDIGERLKPMEKERAGLLKRADKAERDKDTAVASALRSQANILGMEIESKRSKLIELTSAPGTRFVGELGKEGSELISTHPYSKEEKISAGIGIVGAGLGKIVSGGLVGAKTLGKGGGELFTKASRAAYEQARVRTIPRASKHQVQRSRSPAAAFFRSSGAIHSFRGRPRKEPPVATKEGSRWSGSVVSSGPSWRLTNARADTGFDSNPRSLKLFAEKRREERSTQGGNRALASITGRALDVFGPQRKMPSLGLSNVLGTRNPGKGLVSPKKTALSSGKKRNPFSMEGIVGRKGGKSKSSKWRL